MVLKAAPVLLPATSVSRRSRFPRCCLAIVLAVCLTGNFSILGEGDAFAQVVKKPRPKIDVFLLKDHPRLGAKGRWVKVKRGYYRNFLLPMGIVTRDNIEELQRMEAAKKASEQKAEAKSAEDLQTKWTIDNLDPLIFERKKREGSDAIYGSLTAINIAEEIAKKTGIAVRPANIVVGKIAALGDFGATVKIDDSDMEADVRMKVVPEGWKPPVEGEGEEQAEEEAAE
mmetsp:Transcript_89799/g.159692  ORF Transcript_89799/g.159692 Transcript_89799/m.159692 type:complete len:228 (-) Transcript_89799:61-744(-)|eukprot:CAMPEP_0197627026 /NCGR_PEP_ID=MMETSP1338-20131121/5757_1 /TAXON_ID=43686 ORGANISM="Pelagodinium beii, Strain RCC1491" /NCGR_SAMPLE_ID=MMETSP1338 /ASSEMBLY_ACC=CAM_ASM_000754 /LENGTH=227 /DNA_ID=CAMNT_0043197637 /DNA_START=20 /DNA_END=703 /DNA_ORIENTATION=-